MYILKMHICTHCSGGVKVLLVVGFRTLKIGILTPRTDHTLVDQLRLMNHFLHENSRQATRESAKQNDPDKKTSDKPPSPNGPG